MRETKKQSTRDKGAAAIRCKQASGIKTKWENKKRTNNVKGFSAAQKRSPAQSVAAK